MCWRSALRLRAGHTLSFGSSKCVLEKFSLLFRGFEFMGLALTLSRYHEILAFVELHLEILLFGHVKHFLGVRLLHSSLALQQYFAFATN